MLISRLLLCYEKAFERLSLKNTNTIFNMNYIVLITIIIIMNCFIQFL